MDNNSDFKDDGFKPRLSLDVKPFDGSSLDKKNKIIGFLWLLYFVFLWFALFNEYIIFHIIALTFTFLILPLIFYFYKGFSVRKITLFYLRNIFLAFSFWFFVGMVLMVSFILCNLIPPCAYCGLVFYFVN
jgi:hypothetical protein